MHSQNPSRLRRSNARFFWDHYSHPRAHIACASEAPSRRIVGSHPRWGSSAFQIRRTNPILSLVLSLPASCGIYTTISIETVACTWEGPGIVAPVPSARPKRVLGSCRPSAFRGPRGLRPAGVLSTSSSPLSQSCGRWRGAGRGEQLQRYQARCGKSNPYIIMLVCMVSIVPVLTPLPVSFF
jgi:hypothetical protein